MSQLNVFSDTFPPNAQIYSYAFADTPGVVASNNYLSVFNPVGSVKTIMWVAAVIHRYATGATSTPNSMCLYRTTAASAGTAIAAGNILKFNPTSANSIADVRTGNPTVTLLNNTVFFSASPPMSVGAGNVAAAEFTPELDMLPVSYPGQGLVFNTAAGDTDQTWGLQLIWAEY